MPRLTIFNYTFWLIVSLTGHSYNGNSFG